MKTLSKTAANPFVWLAIALLLAAVLKAWLVLGGWLPFNADEAVVALMARHILQGARPVFFYGQAYLGSLDAFLIAGAFALFGESGSVIRLVQAALYLGFLLTTARLGKAVFDRWSVGALAALLLAIPPVNLTLYSTVSLGGYGEALLIGNLILLSALDLRRSWQAGDFPGFWLRWGWLGFLCGLGLWTFGLTLVYMLPALVFLGLSVPTLKRFNVQRLKTDNQPSKILQPFGALACGVLLGSLPWWLYAIRNGLTSLVTELGGGAIAGVEGLNWTAGLVRHTVNLLLFGLPAALGLRPPWDLVWLALPLFPFALAIWLGVFTHILHSLRPSTSTPDRSLGLHSARWLLAGVMLTLVAAFILTPFGADPSGRYFLPLAAPLALFAAELVFLLEQRFGRLAFLLPALLIIFQFWGIVQSALKFPPGITTQFDSVTQIDHRYDEALIDFLLAAGETRGYSNYWTAYPLAFRSQERLIFVPRLPYHPDFRYTARDDRYPSYAEMAAHAPHPAYITTNHPALDERLRKGFIQLGVTWQETRIGDYQVFFRLSQAVHPAQLGLGETTHP